MAKIQVISVDLGDPVEQIISDDVRRLSEDTIANIQTAANQKKEKQINPETLAAEAACELLLAAVPTNELIEIDKLLEVAKPAVSNSSALIMRIKTLLRKKGNIYILRKKSRCGKPVYYLMPFNLETDNDNELIQP